MHITPMDREPFAKHMSPGLSGVCIVVTYLLPLLLAILFVRPMPCGGFEALTRLL